MEKIERETTTYATYAELQAEADRYVAEGWIKLPCDDPEFGTIAYLVFRKVYMNPDEERVLCWKPFGDVTPNVTVFGANMTPGSHEAVVAEAEKALASLGTKQLFRADNPVARLIGFVHYEEGKAHILRLTLGLAKAIGQKVIDFRDTIPQLRDALP